MRDASSKNGEYTLTLTKGGSCKLIKIYRNKDRYGFSEPFEFKSVKELVENYQNESLRGYHKDLDTKLLFPVSRFNDYVEEEFGADVEGVEKKLREVNSEYLIKSTKYDKYYEDFLQVTSNITLNRQASEAFKATNNMIKEQIELHKRSKERCFPHEKSSLENNYKILDSRLKKYQLDQQNIDKELRKQLLTSRALDEDMNALKPEIITLFKHRQQLAKWLRDHGKAKEDINNLLENWSVEERVSGSLSNRHHSLSSSISPGNPYLPELPHNDMATWYMPKVDRNSACSLLEGKPHGTFLIRESRDGQLALSILCKGVVEHCKIEKTDRGFGFKDAFNIYPSLLELVLHYSKNSLEVHNEVLTTTLEIPLGTQLDDNDYVSMQK